MTLLIFDCDGVLVDSEAIALATLAKALTDLGRPCDFADCRRLFMGKSVKDVLALIETMLGRPLPEGWGVAMNKALLARLAAELQPVEGVVAAIEALPYPRCVASSSSPERIKLSLKVTGLAAFFGDRIFSATEVAHGKPAPDLFLFAAERCGIEPQNTPHETIVIEDSPAGITAAQRAGMQAIGFAGASHADAALAQALVDAGAAKVITQMTELPAAIESLRAASRRAARHEKAS